VRAFVVEDFDKVVEPGLLLEEVASGRPRGFFLQGEMHALMAAVLLGMAGLDPFNANTQPEPPDRETAQADREFPAAHLPRRVGRMVRQIEEYEEDLITIATNSRQAGVGSHSDVDPFCAQAKAAQVQRAGKHII
jgi:hypothetical protein